MDADPTPYEERDNVGIATAMQNLVEWKKTYIRLSNNYREYKKLASVFGEQDLMGNARQSEMGAAEEMFNTVKAAFDKVKSEIEEIDSSRELARSWNIQSSLVQVVKTTPSLMTKW